MGDIAQRGNKLTAAKGGRIGKFGGGRTNLLEELGRVEAEPSNRNRRAEISRVHGELNRGYATGGVARGARKAADTFTEKVGGSEKGKPHSTKEGRIASGTRKIKRFLQSRATPERPKWKQPKGTPGQKPEWKKMPWKPGQSPKMQPLKKGGKADKKWMQKVSASIKKRGTKGKCTPITKPGCTGRAKALAKTFKKIAAKRKKS
jgi:hypothetical protein